MLGYGNLSGKNAGHTLPRPMWEAAKWQSSHSAWVTETSIKMNVCLSQANNYIHVILWKTTGTPFRKNLLKWPLYHNSWDFTVLHKPAELLANQSHKPADSWHITTRHERCTYLETKLASMATLHLLVPASLLVSTTDNTYL